MQEGFFLGKRRFLPSEQGKMTIIVSRAYLLLGTEKLCWSFFLFKRARAFDVHLTLIH